MEVHGRPDRARVTLVGGSFVTAACALLVTVGADANWLAALGRDVARSWSIPAGVPFAALPSDGWHNVPVLGELVFHWLQAGLGERGLLIAQLAAVVTCLSLLVADMRRAGAADAPAGLVLVLTALAATPSLVVVRSQLFSLALFPLLVLLLRSDARTPSRRIWCCVPLVAIWSNLHGGVLLGVLVAGAYLLFGRARRDPLAAAGVLAGMLGGLLATPALLRTVDYYRGVVGSEAAVRGEGMWAPLTLSAPFDVLFLVASLPLLVVAWRSRPRAWEAVALLGLGLSAVHASRNEVWFALFLAPLAAKGLSGSRSWQPVLPRRLGVALTVGLAAVALFGFARAPARSGASSRLIAFAARAAGGTPILADGVNAEELALAGDRILIGNPLDAFPKREQRLYLDWLAGRPGGDAEAARARVAVVSAGSQPERRLRASRNFRAAARDGRAVVYVRVVPARVALPGGRSLRPSRRRRRGRSRRTSLSSLASGTRSARLRRLGVAARPRSFLVARYALASSSATARDRQRAALV